MNRTPIETLDLNFQGVPGTIASYLIRHREGAVLIDTGPGSTQAALQSGLEARGLQIGQVTDVLLTHIHLDHAGAAGWLARQGVRIHVHPVGAPHLLNPGKLLASAARIYGSDMDRLWGPFLSVPPERLMELADAQVIEIGGLRFTAIDTPGHAEHHMAFLFEDTLFSGDIGGVRLCQAPHILLPVPPPEFNLEKWRRSVARLTPLDFARIAPTHFDLAEDREWHMNALSHELDALEEWMERDMPRLVREAAAGMSQPAAEIIAWVRGRARDAGLDASMQKAYDIAAPSWMMPEGVMRYWKKYRAQPRPEGR